MQKPVNGLLSCPFSYFPHLRIPVVMATKQWQLEEQILNEVKELRPLFKETNENAPTSDSGLEQSGFPIWCVYVCAIPDKCSSFYWTMIGLVRKSNCSTY